MRVAVLGRGGADVGLGRDYGGKGRRWGVRAGGQGGREGGRGRGAEGGRGVGGAGPGPVPRDDGGRQTQAVVEGKGDTTRARRPGHDGVHGGAFAQDLSTTGGRPRPHQAQRPQTCLVPEVVLIAHSEGEFGVRLYAPEL